MNPRDGDPLYVHEDGQTRQERRSRRALDRQRMVVTGRSVFLLRELAGRAVQRRKVQHRKRGAKRG